MIQLTEDLWIGDSHDGRYGDITRFKAILNVAQDLQASSVRVDGVEYAQVGLVDGPGNPTATYCAAVLELAGLFTRGRVLVFDHTGGRALAVSLMYLHLACGRRGWDQQLLTMLRERVDGTLPEMHEEHRAAFDRINWCLLASAVRG